MKARSHPADYYRRILSAQPHGLKRLDPAAAIMHCHRGQEIPNSSGPAGHWYCVIVGAVRRCTIRSDGRRQILDLMLPQDFFFVSDSKRDGAIEAVVEETVLASYPGARIEQLAERDPLFARELREVAFQSLTRSQEQLQILGGITAIEKVGSFLLSLDGRGSEKRGKWNCRCPAMTSPIIWPSRSRPCVGPLPICSIAALLPWQASERSRF